MAVEFEPPIDDATLVRNLHPIAVAALLLSCREQQEIIPKQPEISGADFEAFKGAHPGMTSACLDEVRRLGFEAWRPDDPECFDMLPAMHWEGLWNHGWEWTDFCPSDEQQCDWPDRGTWLIFAGDAGRGSHLPDGIHRIEFIGRRTRVPGNFGHLGGYDHLMVVERVISIRPIPGMKYTTRDQ